MSTTTSMQEASVQELILQYNLIVPEIQREYVWGFNDYNILDTFITDIKEGYKQSKEVNSEVNIQIEALKNLLISADEQTRKSLTKVLEDLTNKVNPLNIGFLYSYRPDYYVFNDRNDDVYLIDGQQRFTTLFLMLFYLAIKENKVENFTSLFRFDKKTEYLAFDYRVRTLTHNFFIDLISNTKSIDDLLNIRSKNWFLSNYDNDVTVQSIVGKDSKEIINGVFSILDNYFKKDDNSYFEYVKNHIKFWHFKTEETSQGEELYITMNSRGQQLADNETIRARLFDDDSVKANQLEWSEKWELWQDFFWKHRNKKNKEITADEGFNEFLRWVQIIKMTESQEVVIDDDNEDALDKKDIINVIKWGKGKKLNINYLQLSEIENYFKAVKYLFVDFREEVKTIEGNYESYSKFDLIDINWLSPSENSIEQIDSFRLLPILYYCKIRITSNQKIDVLTLFRIIRYFYNLRRDTTVFKTANMQTINGLKLVSKLNLDDDITSILDKDNISTSLLNKEEKLKFEIFNKSTNRFKTEDLFWRAEEINQNKGEIKHIINFISKSLENENDDFDLIYFESFLKVFEEIIEKRYYIWGNLLGTNVYNEYNDRIANISEWHKNDDFLNFILSRHNQNIIGLEEFLIKNQKEFIKKYDSIEEIKAETSFKNQVYIYFIVHKNILKKETQSYWDNGLNFGAFTSYEGYKSMFDAKYIYQQFDKQFRENENKLLLIHKNCSNRNKIIEDLLNWSKK